MSLQEAMDRKHIIWISMTLAARSILVVIIRGNAYRGAGEDGWRDKGWCLRLDPPPLTLFFSFLSPPHIHSTYTWPVMGAANMQAWQVIVNRETGGCSSRW